MKAIQTTSKDTLMNMAALYAEKFDLPSFLAWVATFMVVALGLRYVKVAAVQVLMKLYEVLIQKNAMQI